MNEERIEEILKNIGAEDVPADVHKIAEQTSKEFTKTLTQTKQAKHNALWEYIMTSKITKLAAAAVIIIGALVAINFYAGSGTGVALADVLDRIERVQAFMYRIDMKMTGNMMPNMPSGQQEMQATIIISNEFGMKMETRMTDPANNQETMAQQMYIIPDQKMMLMVMPEQKKYMRMEFSDDLLTRMKKQNNDPRETIKQIMSCEYTELGRSTIDGIEVEGFRTTDPAFAGGAMEDVMYTLWVDVENWLPVRAEMNLRMNEQMQMSGTMYDFQWDIPLDKSEFEPVIPEDYTAFPTDGMKMPAMNEESAIEGLKLLSELTGKYPENLNIMTLVQEINKLKDSQDPAAMKFKKELEQLQTEEERAAKTMEMMMPIQSLGGFYITLVQEKKDPTYYGDSIGPNDVDAVLLRWKTSEDNYRVIFGDLTTEDVTAEELAELENPPSQ